MKPFTTNQFTKRSLGVLAILLIVGAWSSAAWGATLTAKVAVGSGKGSAKVELYSRYGGGAQSSAISTNSTQETITYGVSILSWGYSKYTATAAAGYTFEAWYSNAACTSGKQTGNPYETSNASGNRTDEYWAKFNPNTYTITLNKQSGSGGTSSISVTFDADKNLTSAISQPTRAGYTFAGYYTGQNGAGSQVIDANGNVLANVEVGDNTYIDGNKKWVYAGNLTIFAKWIANNYTVTFNPNEGSVDLTSKSVTFDGTYGDLPTPTRRFYAFDGWYTEAENGSKVSSTTKVSTAADHSLFAHWTLAPEHQTISWNEMPLTMTKGSRQPISLISTSGLDEFIVTSQDPSIITVKGGYLEAGNTNGEVNITAIQPGNMYFYPDTLVTLFTVSSKETPYFFENGFSADEVNEIKVGSEVTLNVTNVSEGLDGDFTVTSAKNGSVIEFARESNTIVFTALHAGKDTITVTQNATEDIYAATRTYIFNVTRYEPEFTLSKNALELEQTATLTLNHIDGVNIVFVPEGVVSYDGSTGVITAMVVGSTTLTVSQAQTNSIAEKNETFEISVSKKTPTLIVKMNGVEQTEMSVAQGRNVAVAFDQISDGQITVSNEQGVAYASYANDTMTANAVGKAVYRATLSETETYKSAYVDFTLNVTANSIHLPMTMSSDLWNNAKCKITSDGDNGWDNSNGIRLGGSSTSIAGAPAYNWNDKYVTIHFEGIPDVLSFGYAVNKEGGTGASNGKHYIEESVDGETWTECWSGGNLKESFTNISQELKKDTRYLRFHYTANFAGYYKGVTISEKKSVDNPVPAEVDFGTANINSGLVTKTVSVNWCNVAPLTVTSSNPRFTVTPKTFGNYEKYSTQVISIGFVHEGEGEFEGDITISNGLAAYNKTIHVTAKTIKRPQTITWNEELVSTGFAMNVGEQYPSENAISVIATATNGGRITFTTNAPEYVDVIADTALIAVAPGKARITAHQVGDAEYQPADSTVEFTVTELQKQSIDWNQNLQMLLTTSQPVKLDATASSNGKIKYSSANESVVKIQGDSLLIVVGEGITTVTATQEGGLIGEINYLEISKEKRVVVRNPASQCTDQAANIDNFQFANSTVVYDLEGSAASISFSAKHGERKNGIWDVEYASLFVDQYNYEEGAGWDWRTKYVNEVGTEGTSAVVTIDSTATKIRFRTSETATHTISNISVPRRKFMSADINVVNVDVENNTTWQQAITISHSNIDLMTVSTKKGLLNLSTSTLGAGCGSYGDDAFTASFTPTVKNQEYKDTIVITDGKAKPSTIVIPVRLYSKGLNQSISGFELPTAALTTDEIQVSATASSELEVLFHSSDSTIAYVGADSTLVILKDGQVTITATQEGNDKYDAAQPVEQTIVISKAPVTITTAPTAADLTYGQALSESALTNGAATVDGEFAWEAPQTIPAAGTPTYTAVFTPAQRNIYATASTLVSVRVEKATPQVTTAPTASDITIAQSVGESQLTGGEATVEGTFAWKNPEERRLPAGAYTRTVVFTPTDVNYNSVEISVNFNVINVLARITEQPTTVAENAVYGITLADVTLVGGSANVEGAFSWRDSTIVPQAGTHAYPVLFTPEDLELYAVVNIDIDVTIAKATPAIETLPTASSILYGAALAEAELTDGAASVEGEFAWVDGTLQLNAGEHTEAIIFMPTDSANYNAVEDTVAVLVGQAPLTVTAEDKTVIFGDEIPEYTAQFDGFVNGENEQILLGELAFACEYTPSSEVGKYTITPSGLTAENYAITFVDGLLTVTKTAATLVAPTALEPTYTGEAQELVAAGSSEDGELQYRLGEEGEWGTNIPTAVDAGDYSVFYQLIGDDSHADVEATEILVHIAKADVEILVAPTTDSLAYGQKLQAAELSGEATAEGSFAWIEGDTILNVGEYTFAVVFIPADTANYNAAVTEATVQVVKIDAVLLQAPIAQERIVYTGEAHELVVAGLAEGGTIEYSLDAENWSEELPTAIEAGEYTVYYRIVGDANHNSLDGDAISVTIVIPEEAKESQYITWEDELDEVDAADGMIFINALASSGLPVSFTSSDSTIAYVEELDGFYFLYLLKGGEVTITAHQDGNDTYSAAEPIAKVINIISDEEDPETPTAVEDAQTAIKVQKIIRDNQVLIIREGRTYTTTGLLLE